jgi:hypothetical protein
LRRGSGASIPRVEAGPVAFGDRLSQGGCAPRGVCTVVLLGGSSELPTTREEVEGIGCSGLAERTVLVGAGGVALAFSVLPWRRSRRAMARGGPA